MDERLKRVIAKLRVAGEEGLADQLQAAEDVAGLDMKFYTFFAQTIFDRVEPLAKQEMDDDSYQSFLSEADAAVKQLVNELVSLYNQHKT